jgi:hypothetical protein
VSLRWVSFGSGKVLTYLWNYILRSFIWYGRSSWLAVYQSQII